MLNLLKLDLNIQKQILLSKDTFTESVSTISRYFYFIDEKSVNSQLFYLFPQILFNAQIYLPRFDHIYLLIDDFYLPHPYR